MWCDFFRLWYARDLAGRRTVLFLRRNLRRRLVPLTITIGLWFPGQPAAGQKPRPQTDNQLLESVSEKTAIYSASADAGQEIQDALKRAVAENRRVMLIFGANWCYDCHVLDRALHEGKAGQIVNQSFVLVHVDIGEGERNPDLAKMYRIPVEKGVPAVAILSAAGKLLYSSGEGEFEAARRMMKKDLVAFLNHWKSPAAVGRP